VRWLAGRAFREKKLPVVLVNVAGRASGRTQASMPKLTLPPDGSELVPELQQQPSDYVVTKQRVGAFLGTTLDSHLREHGVTQVLVAGIATSAGVERRAGARTIWARTWCSWWMR
jgi:nicotinamidase-related amidase